jgi:hypothetical protein
MAEVTESFPLSSTTSCSTFNLNTTFHAEDRSDLLDHGGSYEDNEEHLPTSWPSQSQPEYASSANATPALTPIERFTTVDDSSLKARPARQVDYLLHEWVEDDIWSSWRYIVSKGQVYGERSRLENALWRAWVKQKYRLRTVLPETLDW